MSQGVTHHLSHRLNRLVEALCALLLLALVVDVWLGIVARYVLAESLPWTEELARYLMIWTALLAVSSGIVHREHIGLKIVLEKLPLQAQRWVLLLFDAAGFLFFAVLFWYGWQMTLAGEAQYANIFGMTMTIPFAAVPVAASLACVQLILRGLADFHYAAHGEEIS